MTKHYSRPLSARFTGIPEDELEDPTIGGIYVAKCLYDTSYRPALLEQIDTAFASFEPDFNIKPDVPPDSDSSNNNSEFPATGVDKVAWYRPARYHKSGNNKNDWYGIHFDAAKIKGLALRIQQKNFDSTFKSRARLEKKWLHAAVIKVYCHEVCHGWVEDLCSIAQTLTGVDYYTETTKRFGFYLKEEEAICNTSALSMTKFFYEVESNDEISSLIQSMKSAPPGYRDFRPAQKMWPKDEEWIHGKKNWASGFAGLMSLLTNQYEIDRDVARYAITHFFGPSKFSFPKLTRQPKFSKHGSFNYIPGNCHEAKSCFHRHPYFQYRDYPIHIYKI